MLLLKKSFYKVFDVISPVVKLSCTWNFFPMHDFLRLYIRNIGKSGKNPFPIQIAKSLFYIIFCVQFSFNNIVLFTQVSKMLDFRCDFKFNIHSLSCRYFYLFESPWVGTDRAAIRLMVETGNNVILVGCSYDEHVRITLDAMGMGVLHWALGDRTKPCELDIYNFSKLTA